MATQRILLDDSAGQQFSTIIDGVRVTFDFRYNTTSERFYFSMKVDDEFILQGRTLVGETDVFASMPSISSQFGSLVALDIEGAGKPPTINHIASGDVRVFLVTPS